jgi:hypothetical protein
VAAAGNPDRSPAVAGTGSVSPARTAFLTLRFGVELWTFGVIVVAAVSASAALGVRVVLAIAGPLAFALIWGLFMGPRARWRLRHPVRMVAELVIFAVSGVLLGLSGHWLAAAIYLIVAIGGALLSPVIVPEP